MKDVILLVYEYIVSRTKIFIIQKEKFEKFMETEALYENRYAKNMGSGNTRRKEK